jgi:TIR domain
MNVFVCYKKVLIREREGKTVEQIDSKAGILHYWLKQDAHYLPWMDEAELGAGMIWEAEIYRKILISDVLLVLIGSGTSKSQWVQREIALAHALGIAIVPLGVDLSPDEMLTELKALDLQHFQGKITHNINLQAGEPLLAELRVDLLNAAERTKMQQEETLRGLLTRRIVKPQKAGDNKSTATFVLARGHVALNLHVASGDISKMRGIDAFVNSENDYMQMARFFESKTVSATLRRMGARIRDGRYDDAIQHELDFQLRDRGRPVQYSEVFVTSSGGPVSVLAKENKARYILHVAAVQAVPAEGGVIPFKQPFQIEACVRSVLDKIVELNQNQGMVSPPGSEQRIEQELRAANGDGEIRSVIFPLFGTGQGGEFHRGSTRPDA